MSDGRTKCPLTGYFQRRELLLISRRERKIQLLCCAIPMGMCSDSHPPDFSSRILGTPFRQGPHPSAPAPIHPTSTPHRPPQNHGPQNTASSHGSIVCVGSSSARLLSGAAPQHVLYAQTDDTAALARQLRHKDDNVLPRSFINTPSSPSQPHSK